MGTTTTQRTPRAGVLDDRRALLQRVLWSRPIEKSARIRDLLTYVCERTFDDPAAEVHEQEIGHKVFGRPADYDTALDNVVRVTASQARKKLEQYFATDGVTEPVVLEIPKGQYTPVFRDRQPEAVVVGDAVPVAPIPLSAELAPVSPGVMAPARSRTVWALAIVCAVLGVVAGWSLIRLRAERIAARPLVERDPALRGLWSQLLSPSSPTDIVLTDSSLSLFQELLDHQLSLSEYLNLGEWSKAQGLAGDPRFQQFAQQAAQRRFTSIGSVTAAYRIAKLAGGEGHVSIFSARDFNIRQMKFDNVVLLGSRRANPWMEMIEDRLNFHFEYDQASRRGYFVNRHPAAGEAGEYRTDAHSSYCQVAFVPNLDRTGNILAIAGTEVEGTEGGGEFVTNASSMGKLRGLVKAGADGKMGYFELLLKSERVGGLAPGWSVVAVRGIRL